MWSAVVDVGGSGEGLDYAFWTFMGAVVAGVTAIAVALIKARWDRSSATTPAQPDSSLVMQVGAVTERTREHGRRFEDWDDRYEQMDRMVGGLAAEVGELRAEVDRIKRFLARHHHDWAD